MKSIAIVLAAGFLLARTPASFAQTVDEVIEKSLTAQGGRAALAKIKSRTMTGAISLQTPGGEIAGTIEIYNKAPNKSRSVIKMDLTQFGAGAVAIDQRFDGTSAYVIDPLQGNRDITGNQLDNMKNGSFPSAFLDYKDRGVAAALLPAQKVAGRDMFVVELKPKSGSAVKNYIDTETFLLARSVVTVNVPQIGADVENTVDFSDYRALDGVKVPFVSKLTSSVQNYTITLSKVEHNTDIDEKMFGKP
jgi:outer membrane lipoprotein-sorting protein